MYMTTVYAYVITSMTFSLIIALFADVTVVMFILETLSFLLLRHSDYHGSRYK